jgi:hypothetical protein
MLRRSNLANPEIPQGKARRMPHAVNYLHGSVHYNGGYVLFRATYQESAGRWRPDHPISHPFQSATRARAPRPGGLSCPSPLLPSRSP